MTTAAELAARAEALRRRHHGPMLVLPNAWDAASARAFTAAGFGAVATTSGGVAASLGWEDGEAAPPAEMLAAVSRIAAAVDVPVTADLEAGYGLAPGELVDSLLAAGAVGLNLEDTDHRHPGTLVDADTHAERLAAVKDAGRAAGVDVVLNARVDVHVRQIGPPETRLTEAVRRARLYLDAGADCVYPITVSDEETITALVGGLHAPVNILSWQRALPISRLAQLGVARVSFGSGLMRQAMATVTALAADLYGQVPAG